MAKKGGDSVYKVVQLVGTSAKSWEEAAKNAVETAAATLRDLRVGEIVLCGPYYGKVRALINEEGQRLKEAAPSVAVKMLGLNGVPEAGLEFSVVEDEKSEFRAAVTNLTSLSTALCR